MARIVYGIHPASEALKAPPDQVEIEKVYLLAGGERGPLAQIARLAKERGVPFETVPKERLARLAEGGVHQGVVLQVSDFRYAELEDVIEKAQGAGSAGLLLVLDGIEDPHNLGALARSALALGAQGLVIAKDRAAGVTPTAVKSSAGALTRLPLARVTNLARALEQLKEAGFWTAAADMEGDRLPEQVDFRGPMVVVVGSEGRGVRRLVLETCDFRVRIPMVGELGSLNASVAGAILLYEATRQRRTLRQGR